MGTTTADILEHFLEMPGTVLTTTLRGTYNYYPYFIDQGRTGFAVKYHDQGHTANRWDCRDPGGLAPDPVLPLYPSQTSANTSWRQEGCKE